MTGAAISGRAIDRVLALLADGEGVLDGGDPPTLRVVGANGLRRLRLDHAVLAELHAADLVASLPDPADPHARRLVLTAAGRSRRDRTVAGGVDFRRQHGDLVRRPPEGDDGPGLVDAAESPLARLARRRDKDGRAFLTPARFAAGERLRSDFTVARMMPTVTSNWSAGRIGSGCGAGGFGDLTDRALAARDRVCAALGAVGDDLADVLLDVCCFLKGLETIESERRWPVRSAKVVLDIALGRLADHYGLADEAQGPDRARRIRAWGTGRHRRTTAAAGEPSGGP